MTRDRRLDVIRGLLLIVMTTNHIGGPTTGLTFQPFGFVSAAEAFFLLSGFVAGMVYTRRMDSKPFDVVARGAWSRTWQIYRYHVAFMLGTLALIALVPAAVEPWRGHIAEAFDHTARGFLLGPLLLFTNRFGVLRLYVIFVAMVPLLVRWCRNGREWNVIAGCALVWFGVQLGLQHQLAALTGLEREVFSPLAWQVPFVAGIILGHRRAVRGHAVAAADYDRRLLFAAVAFAGLAFIAKWVLLADTHVGAVDAVIPDTFRAVIQPAIERSTMSLGRLLNIAAVVYLLGYWLARTEDRNVGFGWIQLLGRHSLQVYTFQAVLVQTWWLIERPAEAALGPLGVVLPNLVAVLLLTIPAALHQRWQDARKAPQAPVDTPVTQPAATGD